MSFLFNLTLLNTFLSVLFLTVFVDFFVIVVNLLILEMPERGHGTTMKTTLQPTGYAYKPVFTTRSYQAWATSPPISAHKSGFGSLSSSSSNTPCASPMRSAWSVNSTSPIRSVIGGSHTPSNKSPDGASPVRSYKISSPRKTVVQQAQSLVQLFPGEKSSDSVSVKGPVSLSARTSPIPTGGSLLEKSSITMTPPASPKSPLATYSNSLPYKCAIGSNNTLTASPVKKVACLSSVRTNTDSSSSHRGFLSSLSSPLKYNSSASTIYNGTAGPTQYNSLLSGSLQERIQATTKAATTSVNAAFDEVEKTINSSSAGYGTLRSASSSPLSSYKSIQSSGSNSLYTTIQFAPNSTAPLTCTTVTVPVYSVTNVLPAHQFKKLPDISKSTAALLSPRRTKPLEPSGQTQSSFVRTLSPVKTSLLMSPAQLKPTSSSSLSNSQEILKDVHEMKEDLIKMSAILQTDGSSGTKFHSESPTVNKMEEEEPYKIVEKVKKDLVKVSEILSKDVLKDSRKYIVTSSKAEDDLEFEIDDKQQNIWRSPPRYETVASHVKTREMPERDFNLAKVVDYLTGDSCTSSLNKIIETKQRKEEVKREGEEKQKRVLKPAMAVQENKLKMPLSIMRPSPSEKELSKLADTIFGTDCILDSPDDIAHDPDKSPLSDSGFETRSERTPSAPPSAEGMGPKALFQEIPPVITETRTEVVHVIRSYEPPEDSKDVMDEAKMTASPVRYSETEPRSPGGLFKDRVKTYQSRTSPEEEMANKGMRLKEETHITTTTRMVYHKPVNTESPSERFDESVSVQDIMKAFHSGRNSGLFEIKGNTEGQKHSNAGPLERDSMPKVERIIEVHIEKGNKTEPTEVIIRETKSHPDKEMYIYQTDSGINRLQNQEVEEQEITSYFPENKSRINSSKLMSDDACKTLKLQSPRSEKYHESKKKKISDKFDSSHSDSDESVIDRSCYYDERAQGGSTRKSMVKQEKPDMNLNPDQKCDKLTLLQYSPEPGSPKKSIWVRASENGQGKIKENLIYEDRVDKTVKEAEEKLNEVSQFFRDKTEKLNDELHSPEKKKHCRTNSPEIRSGPSSTCSSPERKAFKTNGNGEEWSRDRFRDRYSSQERRCASLPSSPERHSLLQHSDDNKKQGDCESFKCSQPSTSKVSSVRLKFETDAQKQDNISQCTENALPPVRKLHETKLPIFQVFSGGSLPKSAKSLQCEQGFKEGTGSNVGHCFNDRRNQQNQQRDENRNTSDENAHEHQSRVCNNDQDVDKEKKVIQTWENHAKNLKANMAHAFDHKTKENGKSNKDDPVKNIMHPNSSERYSPSLKKNSESQIPVRISSSIVDHHQSSPLQLDSLVKSDGAGSHLPPTLKIKHKSPSDLSFVESASIICNGVNSGQIEYIERVTPNVKADIKPLPVYVSIQVDKQYEKETAANGQLSTYKKVVSHESRTMHDARGVFYPVKQIQPSRQGSPEDDTRKQITVVDSSEKSNVTSKTKVEGRNDPCSTSPESNIDSMKGKQSADPEESKIEEHPTTIIIRQLSVEKAKHTTQPESIKENSDFLGKTVKDKRVAYIEFPPPPPIETQQSEKVVLKKASCPSSEAEPEMIEVNLQEEHDRHFLAEPVIRVQPPSPLPSGADDTDSSDDESVFQPVPFKKYTIKMAKEADKRVKHRKAEKNGSNHKETSVHVVVKGDEVDEQNGNDQSITDCSIATTAEFSHDTDATEIDSLDGYDLQDEDDGLNDTKASNVSIAGKTSNQSFNNSKLEVIEEESAPNENSKENGKSKSNSCKKMENGNDQEKIYSLEGRHPERQSFADSYFSYKLEDELNTTFKTVATKGLDFDPWSCKEEEDGVFDAKGKDEDPKPFGLSVEDKSQATTPDTTPARTPTDESTPTSEPNPFPFHEGKMFEMTRSGAIDMSKRDFVEERLQFFQIGEHTANGKSGDKGFGDRSVVVSSSQSKAGERTVEGMVEAMAEITPSRGSPVQINAGCLDTPPCTDIVGETTSCTVTASKVDTKLRTPVKMGIAASITIKKDTGTIDHSEFRADASSSQYVSLEANLNDSQNNSRCCDFPNDKQYYLLENCNNNNNLEASNIQTGYIQCGSVVFNLQSSSEPTLQKASRIEANFCKTPIETLENKSNTQSAQVKELPHKNVEGKCQLKSRLPVKAAGFNFNTQSSGKQKPKQIVKPEARKLDSTSNTIEPRSRIPVKEVKRSSIVSANNLGETWREKREVMTPHFPNRDSSHETARKGVAATNRSNMNELSRQSIKFLQSVSGKATKVSEQRSDEEKQTQAEQSEEDSSTSRSTSLSDPSQSQPSFSAGSSRGVTPSRSKIVRSAGSERRRTRRTGGGKEGSRGTGARGSPPIAEIKPSL